MKDEVVDVVAHYRSMRRREEHPIAVLAPRFQVRDESFHIGAHEVELVHIVLLGRMHGQLCRWQSEDHPALAHVDVRQLEHVSERRAVSLGIGTVDDRVRPEEHREPLMGLTAEDDGVCRPGQRSRVGATAGRARHAA